MAMAMAMKNERELKAEDVMDDIELEPMKTDYTDWDVLVAVAKVLRVRFEREKFKEFTSKATDDDIDRYYLQTANRGVKRKTPMVNNDQEENGQKHVRTKRRSRCSLEEDNLSDFDKEWGNYNTDNKKKKSRERSRNKKSGKKEKEVPYPPPDMPIEFMNQISKKGGTDIKLVIQKVLSKSDCKKDQNRLFISILDADDFLKESEKDLLQSNAKEVKPSIDVVLLQPNLEETDFTLKQYDLRKPNDRVSQQYVLNKPWHEVVIKNGLAENMIIQIWSFRRDGDQLGLAIVKLPEGQELVEVGKSTRNGGSSDGTSTTSTGGATTDSPSAGSPSSLDIIGT